jgi:hypothetical protein
MFHVPSLHVKYIVNLVQNTLMHIKCIGQPKKKLSYNQVCD